MAAEEVRVALVGNGHVALILDEAVLDLPVVSLAVTVVDLTQVPLQHCLIVVAEFGRQLEAEAFSGAENWLLPRPFIVLLCFLFVENIADHRDAILDVVCHPL